MAATYFFIFFFFSKIKTVLSRSHHRKVLISMLESVVTHFSNQIGEFKELSLLSGGQGANENFKLITSKAEYLFKICDEKSQKGLDLWVLIHFDSFFFYLILYFFFRTWINKINQ